MAHLRRIFCLVVPVEQLDVLLDYLLCINVATGGCGQPMYGAMRTPVRSPEFSLKPSDFGFELDDASLGFLGITQMYAYTQLIEFAINCLCRYPYFLSLLYPFSMCKWSFCN